jgi:hypothetical protein
MTTSGGYKLVANIPIHRPDIWLEYSPRGDLKVRVEDGHMEAEVRFKVLQAMRMTTYDAFMHFGPLRDGVWEVVDSPWLAELNDVVRKQDAGADFMARSHHYIVFGYDDVLEVACYELHIGELSANARSPDAPSG